MKPDAVRVQIETNDSVTIELAGTLSTPEVWQGPEHAHPFWEMIFITGGEGQFTHGKTRTAVKAGSVCLAAPDIAHRFTAREPVTMLYIGFTFSSRPERRLRNDIPFMLNEIPGIASLVGEWESAAASTSAAELMRYRGAMLSLIVRIIDSVILERAAAPSEKTRSGVIIDKVKTFLSANVHRNVTIEELADNFYLSAHYLGDIFKKETRVTLKHYHHRLRMQKAFDMLSGTQSITAIADALGFENIHHFSKRFKEYYKIPPSAVRGKPRNG